LPEAQDRSEGVMPNTDYYQNLGVSQSATTEEIKNAYRRLARQYHPDLNPGSPELVNPVETTRVT
jgi:DnaJ-class molecular chaperone